MPWTVPITTEDGTTYPVHFDGDTEPTQDEIEYAGSQLAASHEGQPSEFGSFARSALRSAAPAFAGGRLGAMAGAAVGGAAEGALVGSEVPVVGNIVGGVIGAGLGMYGASKLQSKAADVFNPAASNPFSTASEQRDVQANPLSSELGGLAIFKPNPLHAINAVRSIATAEGRQLFAKGFQLQKAISAAATPEAAQAIASSPEAKAALNAFHQTAGVTGNVGLGSGMAAAQGQDPEHILLAAAQGSLFNDSWLHGGEGHPLKANAEASENLAKVEQSDADFTRKTQAAAEIINQGAQNPDTSQAALAAAEALETSIPQAHEEQKQEISEALKPLAEAPQTETPTEQTDATNQEQVESSLPTQLEGGDQSGKTAEASTGDSLRDTTQGQEKVVSSTYTDESGTVHEGANHIEAAQKAGVEAPNTRKGRETDEYGFMVESPDGTRRVVTRREALQITKANGQLKEDANVQRGRLHSDQVDFPPEPPKPPEPTPAAKEPQSDTIRLANADEDARRVARGELPVETIPQGTKEIWNEQAKQRFAAGDAPKLVASLIENPRPPDPVEHLTLMHYADNLEDAADRAAAKIADPNTPDAEKQQAILDKSYADEERTRVEIAGKKAGSKAGASLGVRAMDLRRNQIPKLPDMIAEAMKAKDPSYNTPLTTEEKAPLEKAAKELSEAKAEDDAKNETVAKAETQTELGATLKAVKASKGKRITPEQKKNLLDTIFGKKPIEQSAQAASEAAAVKPVEPPAITAEETPQEKQARIDRDNQRGEQGFLYMDATGLRMAADVLRTMGRQARDLADFTGKAVARFGDWIKPHVEALWNAVKKGADAVHEYLKGAWEAARKTSERGAVDIRRGGEHAGKGEEPAVPASIHDVPKSVLDALMYEHVAEGNLEPGEAGLKEITQRMKADFEPYLGEIPDDEMQKAIVDYGKEIHPTKDEVAIKKSQLKGEMVLAQHVKSAKEGILPKLRAAVIKGSQFARTLHKELNDEIAKRGLTRKSPDEQRATRLDNKKQRVENSIQDVEKQIDDLRKNIPPKERKLSDIGTDPKLIELDGKLKGLRADRDQIIKDKMQPAPEPGDYFQKISQQVKASEERIKELEAKNASDDLSVEKTEKGPTHPLLEEKRAEVRRLNKELADKRAARDKPARDAEKAQNDLDDAEAKAIQLQAKLDSGDLSKNPVKHKQASAELQAVRDQIKGINKGIADARSAAEKPAREAKAAAKELQDAKDKVAELERKLASGEIAPEERPKRAIPAELQAERDKLSELNKEKADAWRELNSHTPVTKEQERKALDAVLKRKQKQIDSLTDIKRRIDSGEKVERQVKPKKAQRPEIAPYQTNVDRIKNQIEGHYRKLEQERRSKGQKFWDGFVRFKRGAVLSSITVYAKLASAVAARFASHGAEEAVGGVLGRIPGVGKVAAQAPLEGGFSPKSIAIGFSKALTHLVSDPKEIWKTGRVAEIDQFSGKPDLHDGGIVDYIGRLHAIMKSPAKRFAFEAAAQKLTEFELRNGLSPADLSTEPVKMRIMTGAYKAAERAIFQQDNAVSSAFEAALRVLEQKGMPGAARLGRILLPIVKVPTNIVGEAIQYAGGVPLGLTKLAKVWKSGIDNVPPEHADLIMRQLKKGSIGSALLALGYFGSAAIGGFYQGDEKRKIGDVKPGGVRIGGVDIPSWLMHAPAFQVLQMGATMHRVAEHTGLPAATVAAAWGLIEETPFINEMTAMKDLSTERGREKFLGDLARSQVEPQILQQAAQKLDSDTPRKPTGILQNLEMGIPVARENVPIRVSDALPPSDKGVVPPAIQQYSLNGGIMPGAPKQEELKKKNPSITQQKWERYAEKRGQIVKQMLLDQIGELKRMSHDEQHLAISQLSKDASDRAKRQLDLR